MKILTLCSMLWLWAICLRAAILPLPPVNVEASQNLTENLAHITWSIPGSAPALMNFENSDGGWLASSNFSNPQGDFQWTNSYDLANYVLGGYPDSETPPPTAHSGTGLWGTVLYGPHSDSGGFSILSKTFNLEGISDPQMRFWSWNNSNGAEDYATVLVNGTPLWGPAWDAIPVQWEEIVIDLSAYADQDSVLIQFQHYSNTMMAFSGWYLDDVFVGGATRVSSQAASPQSREIGYQVWRMLIADQNEEAQWTFLTPSVISDTTYTDTNWGALPIGIYIYAVKAVYPGGLVSSPAFSNQLRKGMMGILSGSVTEQGSNIPIAGAVISAGGYLGYSNTLGHYSFLVYSGSYNVNCSKSGYQNHLQPGVVIVGMQTSIQNFVLIPNTLSPSSVVAVEHYPNVNLSWIAPGTADSEWIHYDNGLNSDSVGTGGAADFDVAIRFPPSHLQDFAGMSLYALKVWPAQAGNFSIRVWRGGNANAPSIMAVDQPFAASLGTYNTVLLNSPVAISGTQELWFGYRCNVTGGFPVGCDSGPAIDGFGNMIRYLGEWSTLLELSPALDSNWNIQGFVGYAAPSSAPNISLPALTAYPQREGNGNFSYAQGSAKKAVPVLQQNDICKAVRNPTGYLVWRLHPGEENSEGLWTRLTPNAISATSYTDTAWSTLPYAAYKWAVKAVYALGGDSAPAFSNALAFIPQIGTISGLVRDLQNYTIPNVSISCGSVSTVTNAVGAYTMQVPSGLHSVTASHPNYSPVTQNDVLVVTGQITNVNLQLSPFAFDGFENYQDFATSFSPWTLLDLDMSPTLGISGFTWENITEPMAYIIFNPSATIPPITDLSAYGGNKMACSFSASESSNNDWLISPPLNSYNHFSFWARSYGQEAPLARFRVGVSHSGMSPADFTIISGDSYLQAPETWQEYEYNISTVGQPLYIAIQCVSDNAGVFCVDNLFVESVDISDPQLSAPNSELQYNYPNPFNPETTISYSLKDASPVCIDIYNPRGQLVKNLVNQMQISGKHSVVWNGRDNRGQQVSSGLYYYKMTAGKNSSTRKMLMLK